MDVLAPILCAVVVIGLLVLIHEGGHFLAARAFKVRVTELMIGLPGPSIGFKRGGCRFGITAIPLGGYARICGMDVNADGKHVADVLKYVLERGSIRLEDATADLALDEDEAYEALEQLVEWGSISKGRGLLNRGKYMAPEVKPTRGQIAEARRLSTKPPASIAEGAPRKVDDMPSYMRREKCQLYSSLPFWKRAVILLAGIAANLIFAICAFVVIYSIIGIDLQNPQTGEAIHYNATIPQALQAGVNCIVMTFQAILGLFNPSTAAETVSNSTSIVGIAVMSADYFSQGLMDALFFMAIVSVSLGLMNLLPIPPLDGGKFLIELIQKISGRMVPVKVQGAISMTGMALFLLFFVFMLNQDIHRYVLGGM